MTTTTKPLVIYHAHCLDGFTAAWAVWTGFDRNADLHAATYGDAPPDVRGRHVIVVDFSFDRDVLIAMDRDAASLVVLDHHKTAAEALRGLPFADFDMERSGAGMAWDKYHPGEPRHWLIDHIEDRDLWRWALPLTRPITTFVSSHEHSLHLWDEIAKLSPTAAADLGKPICEYIAKAVRDIVKHAAPGQFLHMPMPEDQRFRVVNTGPQFGSDVCNVLARDVPFAIAWHQDENGRYRYSLRSSKDNPHHIDVAELAQRFRDCGFAFTGGGHKHAAGFTASEIQHRVIPESVR